jgi:hypothetical protein
MRKVRRLFATITATAMMAFAVAGPAGAQPVNQDGLVNVSVGDIEVLNDANVAVAANLAATLCDIDVGPVALALLGQAVAVDRSGRERTICQTEAGPVTIEQNQ